jgi:hypothetical protein
MGGMKNVLPLCLPQAPTSDSGLGGWGATQGCARCSSHGSTGNTRPPGDGTRQSGARSDQQHCHAAATHGGQLGADQLCRRTDRHKQEVDGCCGYLGPGYSSGNGSSAWLWSAQQTIPRELLLDTRLQVQQVAHKCHLPLSCGRSLEGCYADNIFGGSVKDKGWDT